MIATLFDKYYIRARFIPTVLTAPPLVSLYIFVASPYISTYLEKILPALPTVGNISFPVAIIFLFVQVNRTISKEFLQAKFFNDERRMPTTNFLLYSDSEYSTETKDKIRAKIKAHFDLDLNDIHQEAANENHSRLLIREAVGQVRKLLSDNEMLFNHNIEYGALRNFLGGCVQAVFFSIALILWAYFVQCEKGLAILGFIFLVIYGFFLLMSRVLMTRYGNDYARILYQQFLGFK